MGKALTPKTLLPVPSKATYVPSGLVPRLQQPVGMLTLRVRHYCSWQDDEQCPGRTANSDFCLKCAISRVTLLIGAPGQVTLTQ